MCICLKAGDLGQTVPAVTDVDDEAQRVIWIGNLIRCDSKSHSYVYFGKHDCWGNVCVCVEMFKMHMIKTWTDQYICLRQMEKCVIDKKYQNKDMAVNGP